MPSLCGTHEENGLVVAVLTGFVPGAIDGWDWYVDELLAALAAPKAEAGALHTPLDSAERIGRLSARMCNALATSSPLIVGPRVTASLQGEYERGIELLAEAAQCTTGDVAESLAHRTARIRAAIEALAVASPVTAQPIHGDLHVGQMLRTTERLLINDFDGSPVAGSPDPLSLRSAMVDLASLVQSVDHVGRIAARRMPTHLDRIHEFIAAGTARTRDAFLTELDPALAPSPTELDAVLTGLCVVQELHELVYAARHLPRWMYVPHASLASMFPDEVIR
jgi:maltokinase